MIPLSSTYLVPQQKWWQVGKFSKASSKNNMNNYMFKLKALQLDLSDEALNEFSFLTTPLF